MSVASCAAGHFLRSLMKFVCGARVFVCVYFGCLCQCEQRIVRVVVLYSSAPHSQAPWHAFWHVTNLYSISSYIVGTLRCTCFLSLSHISRLFLALGTRRADMSTRLIPNLYTGFYRYSADVPHVDQHPKQIKVAVMVAIVGECVVQTPVMVGVGLWPTQLTIVAVMGMYDSGLAQGSVLLWLRWESTDILDW